MFSESDSPSASRRTVLTAAAWAVPIVAAAVATPLAAASAQAEAAPFVLSLNTTTVSLPAGGAFPGFVYLSVANNSSAELTEIQVSISGMSTGGFVVGTVDAGNGPWQVVDGDSRSTLTVRWSGTAPEGGGTSVLALGVTYEGAGPLPVAGVITISAVGASGVEPVAFTAYAS